MEQMGNRSDKEIATTYKQLVKSSYAAIIGIIMIISSRRIITIFIIIVVNIIAIIIIIFFSFFIFIFITIILLITMASSQPGADSTMRLFASNDAMEMEPHEHIRTIGDELRPVERVYHERFAA
eukprot:s2856_g4.t1